MKSQTILALSAAIGLFVLTPAARAETRAGEAVEQLDKAKSAEHPIEHLEKAKANLEETHHVEHGEKWEAVRQVEEAINSARKGEHHEMEEHIERALHEIRDGKH